MNRHLRGAVSGAIAIMISILPLLSRVANAETAPISSTMIQAINTDKARYTPGQQVTISANVTNSTGRDIKHGTVTLYFYHLDQKIGQSHEKILNLKAGTSQHITWKWTPPKKDFQGYLVEAIVRDSSGNLIDTQNTAVDVSSNWTKFPRYGFVSKYPNQSSMVSDQEMQELKNYHIDGIQFYDWQWKHHVPLAGTVSDPAPSWHDIANRTNYRQTILDMISSAHRYGQVAMNYNLLYGAWNGYDHDGSGVNYHWGLFRSNNGTNQTNFPLPSSWNAQQIFVFNPANTNWQNYIFRRESDVFHSYPFDGWQVDQLGNLGTQYDWYGNPVNVKSTFAPFLKNAQKSLHKQLIFNNVGGYGLTDVAKLPSVNPLYIECWEWNGQSTYNDLKKVIDMANNESSGKKSTILAAYMDSSYANKFANGQPGYFNTPGVLLTDATIFASGGDHIELGDGLNMLNAPYFPNHNLVMSKDLENWLRNYYDFMVAYENLLRGNLNNTKNQVVLNGIKTSADAAPGTVWEFTKSGSGYDTIQLINLLGQSTSQWRDTNADYPTPPTQKNVIVKYYYGHGHIDRVTLASPDYRDGHSFRLNYTTGTDKDGNYITFILPRLEYWDMVYIHKS